MSNSTIARRYARALNEEAERNGVLESVDSDVELIRESLEGSRELVLFFESPVISREKKADVVRSLFEERVQPLTLRFLSMLVEKRREELFPEVVHSYRTLRDEQLGIVHATARVAKPMEETEEKKLAVAIEKMTEKRVRLDVEVDTTLLGGLIVQIGDTVYDGSFVNQLQALRERLTN